MDRIFLVLFYIFHFMATALTKCTVNNYEEGEMIVMKLLIQLQVKYSFIY